MKQCKEKIVSAILIIIFLCCQVGCSIADELDASQGGMLAKSHVEEDRTQVIENLEEVHPFFCWKKI